MCSSIFILFILRMKQARTCTQRFFHYVCNSDHDFCNLLINLVLILWKWVWIYYAEINQIPIRITNLDPQSWRKCANSYLSKFCCCKKLSKRQVLVLPWFCFDFSLNCSPHSFTNSHLRITNFRSFFNQSDVLETTTTNKQNSWKNRIMNSWKHVVNSSSFLSGKWYV